MMSTPREIRQRQERLRTASPATTRPTQQIPRMNRATRGLTPVIIRQTEAEVRALGPDDRCWIQNIKLGSPPVVGEVEGVGPWRQTGFPYYCLGWVNFAVYAWGPFDPIGAASILLAMDDGDVEVLVKPLCPAGTALATVDPISGCSFG